VGFGFKDEDLLWTTGKSPGGIKAEGQEGTRKPEADVTSSAKMADRACGLELETEKLRQSGQFALLAFARCWRSTHTSYSQRRPRQALSRLPEQRIL
jgi:hypothetical protein